MAVMEPDQIQTDTQVLIVTPAAVQTIRNLMQQREIPDYYLRVFVAGGGCSGLQYGMAFEASAEGSDTVVQSEDVRLLIDPTSLGYLYGATIDFVDSLMGGGFRIDNPNSGGGCGCGKSFKAKDGEASASEDACGCGGGSCSSSY